MLYSLFRVRFKTSWGSRIEVFVTRVSSLNWLNFLRNKILKCLICSSTVSYIDLCYLPFLLSFLLVMSISKGLIQGFVVSFLILISICNN